MMMLDLTSIENTSPDIGSMISGLRNWAHEARGTAGRNRGNRGDMLQLPGLQDKE